MIEALNRVPFGPGSWALLATFLGSVATLIGQWADTGVFPDQTAWISLIAGGLFAGIRSLQAVAQSKADDANIPGGVLLDSEPTDVP